ncbi:chromate efflux transporter [Tepidimonas sp.]|uniref:chromate efflux transporter n=1 Tax=Tepidimonas sp. TaxID=2002775 RepID=UPI002FE0580C
MSAIDRIRECVAIGVLFLRLGLTSFGGPVAHLEVFRREFVLRRAWLDARAYGDLVALCQVLPGPASSQVGMALGLLRQGYPGALAAWLGFTLPSAVAMAALALWLAGTAPAAGVPPGLLQGLMVAAVAVVAHAVWSMRRAYAPGGVRLAWAAGVAAAALAWPAALAQPVLIALSAGFGTWAFRHLPPQPANPLPLRVGHRAAALWLSLFGAALVVLPVLARLAPGGWWPVVDAFYRIGALIFGGGHVVLPLIQAEVVGPGWIDAPTFLAGYGAVQAMPGPLLTIASYVGAALPPPLGGGMGATVALLAIYAPAFLILAGTLPGWARWRQHPRLQPMLEGVHAGVVGLLAAALVHAGSAAIEGAGSALAAGVALALLLSGRVPAWALVALYAAGGTLVGPH